MLLSGITTQFSSFESSYVSVSCRWPWNGKPHDDHWGKFGFVHVPTSPDPDVTVSLA